jgi:hypothetical protein
MDLAKLDRGVLARALTADGWIVTTTTTGLVAKTIARSSWETATLTVEGASASLRTSNYTESRTVLEARIREGYGKLAAIETAARFGFKVRGETRLENGALKLTLGRTMGPQIGLRAGKGRL